MENYIPKRHTTKYADDDLITDMIIGEDGDKYVVTLSGKDWRHYDQIVEIYEPTARRMADFSHFLYCRHKGECTYSEVFSFGINNYIEQYGEMKLRDGPIDPREGAAGNA